MSNIVSEMEEQAKVDGYFVRKMKGLSSFMHKPSTYPMFMLCLILLFIQADQNLIAANLTAIAREFNLTDIERDTILAGDLNLAFVLVGGFVTLWVGYYQEFVSRKKLFCFIVLVGELGCFCTLFVYDLPSFFITRALTGISVGGAIPIIFSVIGDLFPPEERGRAVGFLAVMQAIGIVVGQLLASSVGPSLGFRAPFAIVATFSLVLAPIYALTTKDPPKGSKDKNIKEAIDVTGNTGIYNREVMTWKKLKLLLRSKTALLIFAQAPPGTLPFAVLFSFFPDYLTQDVSADLPADQKISVEATGIVTVFFGAGSLIGLMIAGFIIDRFARKNLKYLSYLMAITQIIAAIPFFFLFSGPSMPVMYYAGILFPTSIVLAIPGVGTKTTLLYVTAPEIRGTAFAIMNLVNDIGIALGPIFVGLLIRSLGGREPAFIASMCFWFLCAFLMFCTSFWIQKDVDAAEELQRQNLEKYLQHQTDLTFEKFQVEKLSDLSTLSARSGPQVEDDDSLEEEEDKLEKGDQTEQLDTVEKDEVNGNNNRL